MRQKYEIRQISAIEEEPFVLIWDTSYHIGFFHSSLNDPSQTFLTALKRDGIKFRKGTIRVSDDGDILVIESRKTGEQLFAAIPVY